MVGMGLSALLSLHVLLRPPPEGARGQGEHTASGEGVRGAGAIRAMPNDHRSAIVAALSTGVGRMPSIVFSGNGRSGGGVNISLSVGS